MAPHMHGAKGLKYTKKESGSPQRPMASNLIAMASNLLVMACNLLAMASNLLAWPPT